MSVFDGLLYVGEQHNYRRSLFTLKGGSSFMIYLYNQTDLICLEVINIHGEQFS